ncbi:subunit of a sporulation, competence and biofilm formation regulatory complex of RNaseY (RicAFT complex / FAD / two [4Fe-4S]2+) [Ruminococcaceae bacterium BL-6]|nr:subunit of a sporulation, competence and biofilm formation regulatory complex of RNaseY (RicAFT complex / FAD / two [4Fe-4S]2+) [Ruminococcaceae bacterium BL-6]
MAEVIGVRFKNVGKVYYFDPDGTALKKGDKVIVETTRGVECGEVAMENREISDENIVQPLKKLIRAATKDDLKKLAENHLREKSAFHICCKKIADHKLEMKLVDVEYTFDNSKILFYFTADGRVDFRELVKDLASVFRTRIELRQIGVRDEAKMLGGLGICGRPFCCATFLGGFQPVSIKMAKEQGLSLNPVKISGTCGRLMCCLKYEQEAYSDLLRTTPKVNAVVSTPEGRGTVISQNLLTGILQVRLDKAPDAAPRTFHAKDVKVIRDSQIRVNKEELDQLKSLEKE